MAFDVNRSTWNERAPLLRLHNRQRPNGRWVTVSQCQSGCFSLPVHLTAWPPWRAFVDLIGRTNKRSLCKPLTWSAHTHTLHLYNCTWALRLYAWLHLYGKPHFSPEYSCLSGVSLKWPRESLNYNINMTEWYYAILINYTNLALCCWNKQKDKLSGHVV